MHLDKQEKGLELINRLHGEHTGEAIIKQFSKICPKMAEIAIETVFGDVMQNQELDLKSREFCIISSIITLGHAQPQLRAHVEAALNVGATKKELVEIFLQLGFYAGFPAAINGLLSVEDLLRDN
jgi:4-carboxymuconolactone decarboxylase